MAINNNLVSFREQLGKSQKEMSKLLNVSVSFYIKIEYGLRNPSFNFVTKFKERFPQINVNEFFFVNKLHDKCSDVNPNHTGTNG
ncbi:MAG: helix-turn-helix transcriptional regulator [Dehalobacterium sp.]